MSGAFPVFDGHNDTILKLELAARQNRAMDFSVSNPTLDIDLPKARAGGFAGGFFAMYTPSHFGPYGDDMDMNDPATFAPVDQPTALAFTLAMFARLRRLAREFPGDLSICGSAADIRAAMATDQVAIFPHIEGAECIDTDLNALEVLHAAGLRSLGLVWSRPNAFGFGAPMEAQPTLERGQGLTDAGFALVRECDRLGILIDLSHLTEAGFWDVAKTTSRPLIATHSNAHAVSPNARNLTDQQLAAVAESGGIVGLNFHVGFLREDCAEDADTPILQMLRHLDHMIAVMGEDCVALGSDFDGCVIPAEMGNAAGLPKLIAAMRQSGYSEERIAKICYRNWLAMIETSQTPSTGSFGCLIK